VLAWVRAYGHEYGAGTLRNVSTNPVVYAELPGAQHAFDLFGSLRFEMVVDAIEAHSCRALPSGDTVACRCSPAAELLRAARA
jgi:hypothetical protein